MGVRGLMSYCKEIRKKANMNIPKNLGLDAFSLIFLFRERRDDFKAYLTTLLSLGHTIAFVMDKRAQKEKKETVDERKQIRSDAKQEAGDLLTFTQTTDFDDLDEDQRRVLEKHLELKRRDAWCLYSEYVKWLKDMLAELKITLIMAKEEADTVLAKGGYDAVVTSDSDLLIHGVKSLWIPRGVGVQHNEINHEEFLKHLGLSQEQLYEMAFLAGCDVQPKKFVDIQAAVSLLKFYGNLATIQKRRGILTEQDLEAFTHFRKNAWV